MSSSICQTRRPATGFVKRLSATAAIGALVGLPLAMPAWAADPSVTFSGGGLGLLLCGSKPNTSRISVPAEQKVRLTNQLGIDATLNIDGSANSAVANGETVEVQFHRGPVSIGMVPDCPLNLNPSYEQLTVDVRSDNVMSAPAPATSPAARPRPSVKPTANAAPSAGGNPIRGGEDGSPPVPPAAGASLFAEPVPGAEAPDGVILESPATVVHPGRSPRGQALAADTAPVDKGPVGLLAIVATVCVVGVSAGAIRAIITQRATRTEFA